MAPRRVFLYLRQELPGAVCRRRRQMRLKAARFGCYAALWIFFGAAFKGDSALCGARPEALPLDSAAFEKAGETFILRPQGQLRLEQVSVHHDLQSPVHQFHQTARDGKSQSAALGMP